VYLAIPVSSALMAVWVVTQTLEAVLNLRGKRGP